MSSNESLYCTVCIHQTTFNSYFLYKFNLKVLIWTSELRIYDGMVQSNKRASVLVTARYWMQYVKYFPSFFHSSIHFMGLSAVSGKKITARRKEHYHQCKNILLYEAFKTKIAKSLSLKKLFAFTLKFDLYFFRRIIWVFKDFPAGI